MPIYEYRCQACSYQFELMQRFSDPAAETCPTCSGVVQKLISRSAFHLKGGGWYATDYGRNGSKNGDQADKGSTENTDTKSSDTASSDTKSSDAKSSDAKSSDAKSSDPTSASSKTTTATAAD